MILLKKFSLALLVLVVVLVAFNSSTVSSQEDLHVTIGQDKIFTASNVHINTIQVAPNNPSKGSPSIIEAVSEGQIASTHILAGKYQEGNAKSWNGVDFVVKASEDGKVIQEAEISITFDYSLSVDFQVPPPSEEGGGSADAIVYGILPEDPPVTVDRINFIHYSNSDARSGTKTLKKRMMLEAGKSYQVLTHVYSYGDVQIGGFADSQASILVKEINVTFITQCNFSSQPGIERCFGGIGCQCEGYPLYFYKDNTTCLVSGWMSVGSILHDRCCFVNDNNGFLCDGINTLIKSNCFREFASAKSDVQCGYFWPYTFGPYPAGNTGDDTSKDLRAPSGARVHPKDESYCQSGQCQVNAKGKTIIEGKGLCKYCVCQ